MENTKASFVVARKEKSSSFDWVCQWTLSACLLQIIRAGYRGSSSALPDLQLLTPAQAANVLALHGATLWLGVAGGAAAVLAMLLRGRARSHRWALACVGLASAVAIHCVFVCFVGVALAATPDGNHLLAISAVAAAGVIFFAVLDVNAARILLHRRPGGELEE